MVGRMTRVFKDSDATWAALIYQQSHIQNVLNIYDGAFLQKIVNDFSLFPANIRLLSVFH